MGWLKLFALLVAVASVQITAEGPKKKIRIHLPQTVKHIHHHKKIYITNHPAPSQYAPAYLPGVKGSVALPSNIGRPSVAGYVPLSQLYGDTRGRHPAAAAAASSSKLLPLYRARGHYGPKPNEWEDQEFDVASPADSSDLYSSGYSAPAPSPPAPVHPPKRVKIVKVNDFPRKKVIRKVKPKRVIVRGRPQPPPPLSPALEEEHPVSSFHEQFYSDLEEAGTIRKIKKPPRIEKIIDGDTEHIHTYSEEHIHKVVFDDDPKVTGVVGSDHIGSMSALTAAHPLIPLKNAQALLAIPTSSLADYAVVGSMGTPSHMEYSAYNPRDVTHDHIYHDHGEIPPGVDVNKDAFRYPPKVSYNSQGLRISNDYSKRQPGKHTQFHVKHTKPTQDFSYYESMYMPQHRPKKYPNPALPSTLYDTSSETNLNDFRPIPAFRFKEKRKIKTRPVAPHYGLHTQVPSYQQHHNSASAPFTMSTTVVHDYAPKGYRGIGTPAGFSKYRDPLVNFRDSFTNDFDYDNFASSSDVHTTEDKNDASLSLQGKTGQKSVSTQSIRFGGQDSQSYVDHFGASSNAVGSISEGSPSAADNYNDFEMTTELTPTPYTIKDTSPAHSYYTAMALKALQGDQPEASNDNVQYAAPPSPSSEPTETETTTPTSHTIHIFKIQSTDAVTPESENRQNKKQRERNRAEVSRQRYNAVIKELMSDYAASKQQPERYSDNKYSFVQSTDSSSVRGNPKYGDKI